MSFVIIILKKLYKRNAVKLYTKIINHYSTHEFDKIETILEEMFMLRTYSYLDEENRRQDIEMREIEDVEKYDEYGKRTKKVEVESIIQHEENEEVSLSIINYAQCEEVSQLSDEFDGVAFAILNLDGVYYAFAQNPCDGYRTTMGNIYEIEFENEALIDDMIEQGKFRYYQKGPILLNFKEVDIEPKEDGDYDCFKGLQGLSYFNDEVLLWLGTGNYDDYYPHFKAHLEIDKIQPHLEATHSLLEKELMEKNIQEIDKNHPTKKRKL